IPRMAASTGAGMGLPPKLDAMEARCRGSTPIQASYLRASRVAACCNEFQLVRPTGLRIRRLANGSELASPISIVAASRRFHVIPAPDLRIDPSAPSTFPLANIKTDGFAVPFGLTEMRT